MTNMTIEDIKEYRRNAIKILENNTQYATAKAVDLAFNALICVDQFMWERDVAIEQLKELGIGFGQKIDGAYMTNKDAVCFRYKRADDAIMCCHVEESKLYEDGHIDDHCVYLDMNDDDIKNLIEALQSMQSMTT